MPSLFTTEIYPTGSLCASPFIQLPPYITCARVLCFIIFYFLSRAGLCEMRTCIFYLSDVHMRNPSPISSVSSCVYVFAIALIYMYVYGNIYLMQMCARVYINHRKQSYSGSKVACIKASLRFTESSQFNFDPVSDVPKKYERGGATGNNRQFAFP